jgi:hypothetical protein
VAVEIAMSKTENCAADVKQRKNAYARRMRQTIAEGPLKPPVVVGPLLREPFFPSFGEYICLPDTRAMFEMDNDSAELLHKLL